MGISAMQLVKYNPYKTTKSSSSRRYASIMKAILPRKRSSKFRISKNRKWNEDEERCYIRVTHFSKLDFCNEINDNSKNYAVVISQLKS